MYHISISDLFYLMTLNMLTCCTLHWDDFHQFEVGQTVILCSWFIDTLRHIETLTFDPLVVNVFVYRLIKLCAKFDRNRTIRGRAIAI